MKKRGREEELNLVADGLLTVPEAATYLALTRTGLYRLMDAGELAFVKIGKSRRVPNRSVAELATGNLHGGWKVGRRHAGS